MYPTPDEKAEFAIDLLKRVTRKANRHEQLLEERDDLIAALLHVRDSLPASERRVADEALTRTAQRARA